MALTIAEIHAALNRQAEPKPSSDKGHDIGPQAAVAIVLRPANQLSVVELEVLLIERATHPDDPWSGHMALPGGKWEPTDQNLEETAKRETREEVGLNLANGAKHLGALQSVEALSGGKRVGLAVTPHVYCLHQHADLHPSPAEVSSTHWASLPSLHDGTRSCHYTYKDARRTLKLPAFQVEDKVVWGLTHRILTMLLRL